MRKLIVAAVLAAVTAGIIAIATAVQPPAISAPTISAAPWSPVLIREPKTGPREAKTSPREVRKVREVRKAGDRA